MIADAGLGTINGVALTAYYLKEQGIPLKGSFSITISREMCSMRTTGKCASIIQEFLWLPVADGDTELSMDAEDLKALYETAEK